MISPSIAEFNTPENIKQRVSQDTVTITAQSPVTTDGYIKLALDLKTQINRIISTGCASQDPGFFLTDEGKLLILPRYLFGNSVIKLTNQAIVAQPRLRVQPAGVNSNDSPVGIFVYNGGGIGNHKNYSNANGDTWRVWDIGVAADLYPEAQYDSGGVTLTNPYADMHIYDERGKNVIPCQQNGSVGLEDLYIDTGAGSPTDLIVQGSGSNIEYLPLDPTSQNNNPVEQFWLQIHCNDNPAIPVYERLEHNAGGGQVPFPVPVALFTSSLDGQQKLLGYFVIMPNINAATDGELVRDDGSKFFADLADDVTVGIDPRFSPATLTRLQ